MECSLGRILGTDSNSLPALFPPSPPFSLLPSFVLPSPTEPATTSTSSVKLERPTALRAAAAAAVASSKTVPPALGLGGGGGGLEGGREGGREAGSSLPPLSKATFQPPSPM